MQSVSYTKFFGDSSVTTTRSFYKQHFYKQRQTEIGKKLSKC